MPFKGSLVFCCVVHEAEKRRSNQSYTCKGATVVTLHSRVNMKLRMRNYETGA